MEQYGVYVPRLAPSKEYFAPGHRACIGCGEVLALRLVCKALGRDVIIANATGCMEIVSSPLPSTSWRVPWIHTLFENTSAVASGIESALKILRRKGKISEKKIVVVGMGGDGATSDIGLQALSGALERGHDFLYVCFDNEAYMNTGIQRSSSTPYGAMTTTIFRRCLLVMKQLACLSSEIVLSRAATAVLALIFLMKKSSAYYGKILTSNPKLLFLISKIFYPKYRSE